MTLWLTQPRTQYPMLKRFANFDILITPILLKILYWPATLASIYYSCLLISDGLMIGFLPLVVGTLFVRIVFEILLSIFLAAGQRNPAAGEVSRA
jgi:hypothetical protein